MKASLRANAPELAQCGARRPRPSFAFGDCCATGASAASSAGSDPGIAGKVPIGAYIVDFLCVSARLIVEADGSQHSESMGD
jgi:hypothetical protein